MAGIFVTEEEKRLQAIGTFNIVDLMTNTSRSADLVGLPRARRKE